MTEVEKKAYEEYPDCSGPCDKPNMFTDDGRIAEIQREAYIKGATEFCRKIWAKIKVDETKECVGHYSDEQISMATYSNKLNEISEFCYEQYHEVNLEDD